MSNVRSRLNELKVALGWSENSISRGDPATQKRLNRQLSHDSEITVDTVLRILERFPQVSPDWVLFGKGNMLREDNNIPTENMLPLLPMEAFAGRGVPVYNDLPIEDYYTVKEFHNSDFLIRVTGDSMTPKFTGGDIVACKKVDVANLYFLQWGRIYVLYTESQGIMIKRVQPSDKENCIKCVSDNTKYAPFDVPFGDIVSLALVNGSISLE